MNTLRLVLEIAGVALYLAVHPFIIYIYYEGSTLRGVGAVPYWTAIGLGYAVMLGIAVARPGRMKSVPLRYTFDAWLLAAIPALVLCFVLVMAEWPLLFPKWGGHTGANGGEVNAAFFPWVQLLVWAALTRLGRQRV